MDSAVVHNKRGFEIELVYTVCIRLYFGAFQLHLLIKCMAMIGIVAL